MKRTDNDMDELIGKYLAGEATAEESAQLENWRNESDENRKYVDQLSLIFQKSAAIKELQYFDEDAAWKKMKAKLHQNNSKTISFPSEESNQVFTWTWRIAASIVLVLGIGYYVFKQDGNQIKKINTPIEVVAETKSVSDTLPDGSDVFLNKKSKLVYAYDKKKAMHIVKLNGEAYFNIKHDDKKKFLIETEGIFVRDIGTTFNVKAYPESNTIEVVVKEGAVEFFTEKDSGVFLRAGGKGVYDKTTRKFSIAKPETNVFAYKTKYFSFENQDLKSAINDLNQVYDKQIVLSDNLKNCRLTVSFNNEDIDEIARVIADTYGLSLKETERGIILDGASCEQ